MDSLEQFDASRLNELFQNPTTTLIPESLINTIQTGILILTILGVLFLVLYIFSIVRKWKVDSAILQMQKDIAEIKNQGISKTDTQTLPTSINEQKTTTLYPEDKLTSKDALNKNQ